jgi:hypothetical protein
MKNKNIFIYLGIETIKSQKKWGKVKIWGEGVFG